MRKAKQLTMQQLIKSRVVWSCTFFLLAFLLIVVSRPSFAFDATGHRLRPFGVNEGIDDKTILSLGIVTVLLAIASFYMFTIIDILLGAF